MRIVLEALLYFATACLFGTISRWSLFWEATPKLSTSTQCFTSSSLHGVRLSKDGPVALTRWKETRDDGKENWFPKRKKPVVGVQWPVAMDCAIAINKDNTVWIDAVGMPWFKPNASLEDWVLTRRNVEETVHRWKDSTAMAILWHPYVRFVAFYERISGGLTEAAAKISFQNFCMHPSTPCPQGVEQWRCNTIVLSSSSYLRSQSVCTHNDALRPVADVVYDIGMLSGSYVPPELSAVSDFTRQEIVTVIREMREKYLQTVKIAEILYRAYPSCLDRVYEFYHSDFLLLGYSRLKIV